MPINKFGRVDFPAFSRHYLIHRWHLVDSLNSTSARSNTRSEDGSPTLNRELALEEQEHHALGNGLVRTRTDNCHRRWR